ncbi:MAG: hypothetical protein CMJ83_18260 [Planctomycetes bacterium]|nr:hypothetical protein [Planctomycetota bacterium]
MSDTPSPPPRASVIIPVFNGERFLAAAVDSALSQRGVPCEVICVDDGSTDASREVLDAFGDRIRVLAQANAGVSAARNHGAAHATAPYLAFLDQDDLWEPDFLTTQVSWLDDHPDHPLVHGDSRLVDADGKDHGRRSRYLVRQSDDLFVSLIAGNFIGIETILLRADAFHAAAGFDPDLHLMEDWDLWLRLARDHAFGHHDHQIARYRVHDRNLTHDREPLLAEWADVLTRLADDSNLPEALRTLVRQQSHRRRAEQAWHRLRRGDREGAAAIVPPASNIKPLSLRWKIRALRTVLSLTPPPIRPAVVRLLPRTRLHGLLPNAGSTESPVP